MFKLCHWNGDRKKISQTNSCCNEESDPCAIKRRGETVHVSTKHNINTKFSKNLNDKNYVDHMQVCVFNSPSI